MANPSKGFEWAYRDLLTALMVVFMALGLLAIIAAQKLKTVEGVQPGQMFVQMEWKVGSTSDIDLWIRSPDDKPVGYRRSAGKNCDLLRDDLGQARDVTSHALELMVCRDPPPGEYIINVMDYITTQLPGRPEELPMDVTVTVKKTSKNASMKDLYKKVVTLAHNGQEMTVVRFTLDGKGEIVNGSINDLPHMIRTSPGDQ